MKRVEIIKENPEVAVGFILKVYAEDEDYYSGPVIRMQEDGTFGTFFVKVQKDCAILTTKNNLDRFMVKDK